MIDQSVEEVARREEVIYKEEVEGKTEPSALFSQQSLARYGLQGCLFSSNLKFNCK